MKSIRSILLVSFLLLIFSQGGISVYKIFKDASNNLIEFYDKQLIQISYATPNNVLPENDVDGNCESAEKRQLAIIIWMGAAKQPTYRSCNFLELVRPTTDGLKDEIISGEVWRVYIRTQPDRVIAVAQPQRVRAKVLSRLTMALVVQIALLIPLFILVLWYAVHRSLKPLRQFTKELQARSPSALQSVSVRDLPKELIPVADALNELLSRLKNTLASQKNFIADAAHEILTPLTALQVQLQVLERAKTEERRLQATQDVRESLERCVNLARQLLTLARSSTELPQASFRDVDLVTIARHAVEEALPKARQRQIDLGVLAAAPVIISGDELALQVLLRNLIDNSIKYSQIGGRVDVAIHTADEPQLVVSDAGPGVEPEEHARLFDRFYRGSNPDIDGTGLGLAIVKEIAERHHAEIKLRSPGLLGGLDVIIRFHDVFK